MEPASSGKSDKVHRVFFIYFSSNVHFLAFRSFVRLILVVPQSPRGGRLCGEVKGEAVMRSAFLSIRLLQVHMIASLILLTSLYFLIYRFCRHEFCIYPTCCHSPSCQVSHCPIFPEFQVNV